MRRRERLVKPRVTDTEGVRPSRTSPEERAIDFVQGHVGQGLDPAARDTFEPQFGHSFGDIRIHADTESGHVAEDVDAAAFTIGQDIVFGHDRYAPESLHGNRLLGHELAHTVQNRLGSATSADKTMSGPTDSAEVEARQAAHAVSAGESARVSAAPSAAIAAAHDVDADEDRAADIEDWKLAHKDADQGMTEKAKQASAQSLTHQAAASGGRERDLAYEGAAALPTIQLYDTTEAEGGMRIKNFERDYNTFRLPMQLTMGALGRVQDLLTAGAPQTPHEMSKADRAVFKKLEYGKKGSESGASFAGWSDHMASVHHAMDNYMGVFTRLQGSVTTWRGMKQLIEKKKLEARVAKDTDKLKELEEPAETIVQIVEVMETAASIYGTFAPKPEVAEAAATEEEAAPVLDAEIKTRGQRAYEAGSDAKEKIEKTGSAMGLSLKSVIEWAMGDADEIAGLKQSIARLKSQIAAAGEKAEEFEIEGAERILEGTNQEYRTAALNLGTERVKAREGASRFAQYMGDKRIDTGLVALCAEAYQELRIFADKAKASYGPVAENLPAVIRLVSQSGHAAEIQMTRQHERAAREAGDPSAMPPANDYRDLLEAAQTVKTFGVLMETEYKGWQQRADEWEKFFSTEAGSHLDEYRHQSGKGG